MASSFAARYGAALHWFPGHMAKASNQIAAKARLTDVIIEVRDARLPFTSSSSILDLPELANKPRIIVFNKADLASDGMRQRIVAAVHEREGKENVRCVFSASRSTANGDATSSLRTNAKAILSHVDDLPSRGRRFKEAGTMLLVAGMSNVGKSTVINALRSFASSSSTRSRSSPVPPPGSPGYSPPQGKLLGKGAKTGAAPGITRAVSSFLIRPSPNPLYVFDSPGVLSPSIPSVDEGMKLVLCSILPDKIAPFAVQAEYLLFFFSQLAASSESKAGGVVGGGGLPKRVVEALGLSRAYTADETRECLTELAGKLNMRISPTELDLESAGRFLVREFQKGALGRWTLDHVPLPLAAAPQQQQQQQQQQVPAPVNAGKSRTEMSAAAAVTVELR